MFVTDYCCFIGLIGSDRGSPIQCQPQDTARIIYSIQSIIFHLLTHKHIIDRPNYRAMRKFGLAWDRNLGLQCPWTGPKGPTSGYYETNDKLDFEDYVNLHGLVKFLSWRIKKKLSKYIHQNRMFFETKVTVASWLKDKGLSKSKASILSNQIIFQSIRQNFKIYILIPKVLSKYVHCELIVHLSENVYPNWSFWMTRTNTFTISVNEM